MVKLLEFSDTSVPQDEPPPAEYEYACEVCGREIFYGGKGRKPKKCDEHKTVSAGTSTRKGGNAKLAQDAADSLAAYNAMIALGLMMPGIPMTEVRNPLFLPITGGALRDANDGFTDAAYKALIGDPKLCRFILKVNATSSKLSLLVAYGMLSAAVIPVAMMEIEQRKDDNAARPQVA